jgi:hypothetical protein
MVRGTAGPARSCGAQRRGIAWCGALVVFETKGIVPKIDETRTRLAELAD